MILISEGQKEKLLENQKENLWKGEFTPLFNSMPGEDDSPARNFFFVSLISSYALRNLRNLRINSFGYYTKRDSMARGGQALMHSSHPLHLEVSKMTSMVLRLI
jgi:hypothetical protein